MPAAPFSSPLACENMLMHPRRAWQTADRMEMECLALLRGGTEAAELRIREEVCAAPHRGTPSQRQPAQMVCVLRCRVDAPCVTGECRRPCRLSRWSGRRKPAIAQEPSGQVVITGRTQVRDACTCPEELARLCRAMHLQPTALAGCPDWAQRAVRLHLRAMACVSRSAVRAARWCTTCRHVIAGRLRGTHNMHPPIALHLQCPCSQCCS